jgi:hypothetical protein
VRTKWTVLGTYQHPTLGRVTTLSNNTGAPLYLGGPEATQFERAEELCRRLNDAGDTERMAMREVLCRRMQEHGFITDHRCNGRTVTCGWCDNTVRTMQDAKG